MTSVFIINQIKLLVVHVILNLKGFFAIFALVCAHLCVCMCAGG